MNTVEFEKELKGLVDVLSRSGKKKANVIKQTKTSTNLKSEDSIQDLLDYLRICIKYQAFDVEATRRENAYLRKMLEEKGS